MYWRGFVIVIVVVVVHCTAWTLRKKVLLLLLLARILLHLIQSVTHGGNNNNKKKKKNNNSEFQIVCILVLHYTTLLWAGWWGWFVLYGPARWSTERVRSEETWTKPRRSWKQAINFPIAANYLAAMNVENVMRNEAEISWWNNKIHTTGIFANITGQKRGDW